MSESPSPQPAPAADWESFYSNYRKPGYVQGFEITSKLGGGMFGLVFKARRQSIGKDYAIKFLRVDDGEVRRAVLAELAAVEHFAQIDHPNLVSIEDRGEIDGIPYLIMAFAGAETLRDRLPGKLEDRDELVQFFLQVCRGTAALHAHSLVHFDLKPANVFLKGGVARVGDYGLSKLVTHSRGSLSMGRGTPYYMAPEMLESRGDHRSDIYSLGVMLYEILCGDVPFKGENEWEVLRKHENAKLDFPDHVGARERAVVERCMAKDPADRFQAVGDLIAVLGAAHGAGSAASHEARAAVVGLPPVTHTRRDAYAEATAKARAAVTERPPVRPPRRARQRRRERLRDSRSGRTVILLVLGGSLLLILSQIVVRRPTPTIQFPSMAPTMPGGGGVLDRFLGQGGLSGVVDEATVRELTQQMHEVDAALRRVPQVEVVLPDEFLQLAHPELGKLLTPVFYTETAGRMGLEELKEVQLLAATFAAGNYETAESMERARKLHQTLAGMTGLDEIKFVEDPEQVPEMGAFWLWLVNQLGSVGPHKRTIKIQGR